MKVEISVGAVDQGFVDQTQGFADAQVDRTANAGVNAQGFADAGDALTKGFGDTSTQLTETQANVLGGQDTLQGNLDVMSDDNTTYATAALENQAALKTGQEGFQSSFDTYAERYGEDTTLANQTRADMQLAPPCVPVCCQLFALLARTKGKVRIARSTRGMTPRSMSSP